MTVDPGSEGAAYASDAVSPGDRTPGEHQQGFGDPRVDAAMARLESDADRTPAEQVTGYEAVHRVLQDTLATIDEA